MLQNTNNQFDLLLSTCEVVDQINRVADLNVTDYSSDKHTQLQAMKIVGVRVKENICDWVSSLCELCT